MLKSKLHSHIESLPPEIIELIFLYSLEFNMPRSSPILARQLSRERIYRILILYAFFQEENLHHWPVQKQRFMPAEYVTLSLDEKLALQISVLDSRWCTLSRVECCLPDLFDLCHGLDVDGHRVAPSNGLATGDSSEPNKLNTRRPLPPHLMSPPNARPPLHLIEDGHVQLSALRPWLRAPYGVVMDVLAIPRKLLHGPWTEEKLAFLKLLRMGRIYAYATSFLKLHMEPLFGTHNTVPRLVIIFPREVVLQGLADAILEENGPALVALLELLPYKDTKPNVRASDLPSNLFVQAARQAPKFLPLLVRASIETFPKDDPTITSWAISAAPTNEFAKWLLDFMAETTEIAPRFSHGIYAPLEFPELEEQPAPPWLGERRHWKSWWDEVGYPQEDFTREL